jgi:competence protein ComEA
MVLVTGMLAAGLAWCGWRLVTGVRLDDLPAASDGSIAWRVDLNTASAAELELLPGVGPRLAERIVADRAAHGPYESVEALARVQGVGSATVEAIAPYAFVTQAGRIADV